MVELNYCGFPITTYAIREYGIPLLQEKFSHVQYCEHGDRCEKCCFQYTGKVYVAKRTRVPYMPFFPNEHSLIGPSGFFYRVAFGKSSFRTNTKTSCSTLACCNLWHIFVSQPFLITEDFFHHIGVCEHGRLCAACCWSWPYTKTVIKNGCPILEARTGSPSKARTVLLPLLRDMLGYATPKRQIPKRICNNGRCANMWHVRLTSISALYNDALTRRKKTCL